MSALDRKMLRDLWGMRGQAVAIAFVIVAGVASFVSMRSVMQSLQHTLDAYYADYRFADGFASVRRAPEALARRLRAVPGVGTLETRVAAAASLEVPGFDEPVGSRIVSLPAGQPLLNRLVIRAGTLPRPGRTDEVVLNEVFADAHGLRPGDRLVAVLDGRRRVLTVAGIALSPEFLMQLQPATLFPDPERYGVMWMDRAVLAPAYDLDGAFNDITFTIAPGASIEDVIDRLDTILRPYGGRGAYARADHTSHLLITEEFRQLRVMATLLPAIFISVAAFLLNIVVARLIALQREQIAALKAFGYWNRNIGVHYLKLVLIIALLGSVGGTLFGAWAGSWLGDLYLDFYRFPELRFAVRPSVVAIAVALTTGAAVAGVLRSVRDAVRLPPAEAMRPAPPARYRPTIVERLGLQHTFDQPTRMIMRSLERQPVKASLTAIGIASSCALLIMGVFFGDAFEHLLRVQYGLAQREDLTATFVEPASTAAVHELTGLRGVNYAEGVRIVPVRLRYGHRSYETAIEGIPHDSELRRIIDPQLRPIAIPREGLLLTKRLAAILGVRPGDRVTVDVLEGTRGTHEIAVAGISEQYIGLGAYMELGAAGRLAGTGESVSGALLMVDERHEAEITRRLQDRPRVASIVARERVIQSFLDTSAASMLAFTFVLSLFAGVIAFGVIYNSVRISLSERDRELASLRVLGFTRAEVAYILLGELAVLVLVAIPLGFLLGAFGSDRLVRALGTDMYQIPLVLTRATFGLAAVVVLGAGIVSAVMAAVRLSRLDLVGVLKTRE